MGMFAPLARQAHDAQRRQPAVIRVLGCDAERPVSYNAGQFGDGYPAAAAVSQGRRKVRKHRSKDMSGEM